MTISTSNLDAGSDSPQLARAQLLAAVEWINAQHVAVVDADRTGATDASNIIQTAIDAAAANTLIYLPPGTYKIVTGLTIENDRVHLVGAGPYATRLTYAPTANGTCITIEKSGTEINQCSIKEMALYSSDSTYTKTAIKMIDTRDCYLDNIVIGGAVVDSGSTFWGGANSVGLHLKGRDMTTVRRLFCFAQRPILIDENPNIYISLDQFSFNDLVVCSYDHPLIEIASGANISHLNFTGHQAWLRGTHGLYHVDTAGTGGGRTVSQSLLLNNIRTEQGDDAANSYFIYIDRSGGTQLQDLVIRNCQSGSVSPADRKGIYVRNVQNLQLENYRHLGTSNEALNINDTVIGVVANSCYWEAGSTATINGQRMVSNGPIYPSTGGAVTGDGSMKYLGQNFRLTDVSDTNYRTTFTECANGGYEVTLADDATVTLGPTNMAGILTVVDSEYLSAMFAIKGTYNTVALAATGADPFGVFDVADTDTKTCVYWSGSNYVLKNRRGASRTYRLYLVGGYSYFGP